MDGSFRYIENLGEKLSSKDTSAEPRVRDESTRCGFRGCNKFAGHGGFHEADAVYNLPKEQIVNRDLEAGWEAYAVARRLPIGMKRWERELVLVQEFPSLRADEIRYVLTEVES